MDETTNESKKKGILQTVGLVMLIMLAGKITGLLRNVFIAANLGTTGLEADAFSVASMIPRVFLDIAFASAISSSFIPVFNSYLEKKGREAAFRLANNFITILLVLSVCVVGLAMAFSGQIVSLAAAGFSLEKNQLATRLLWIMLPTIIVTSAAFSVTGILQSLDEFNIPAAMSIVSNLIVIAYCLFFMDKYGVYGLAVAFLAGWTSQLVIQLPALLKKKYFYKPYINIKDSGLKEIGVLVLPVMISTWVQPLNYLINTSAVTYIDGAATSLNYANELYSVITGVIILSIANVIFPKLSRLTVQEDGKGFGETLRETISVLFFLILPMTAGLFVLSKPLISLVFERKQFDAASTAVTANALKYYSLGMLGFALQTILNRGFYADRDGKTPLLTGGGAVLLNSLLSFSLVGIMGVGGPALASAVSLNITAVVMMLFMYKKNKAIITSRMLMDLLKIVLICLTMAAVVYLSMSFMNTVLPQNLFLYKTIKMIISVGIGVAWYMGVSYFAKIPQAIFIFGLLGKVLKK